jgi:DNA-binding GntR family transcriptional regulator
MTPRGMIFYMSRTPEPPSLRIEADLRRRVSAGEWTEGQALPSVAKLADEYGVARATVAKVLKRLEVDGLVRIVPAWGTFKT